MTKFTGKVAIVTGAAGGLGAAQVECFLRDGAVVVATDLTSPGPGAEGDTAGRLYRREQDVTSEIAWRALVEWTVAKLGRIDILVNNAGYFRGGSLQETTVDQMDMHYRVNMLGVFLGMVAVAPQMRFQQSGGAIVNISSLTGMRGVPGQFAYAASKWAVRGMTKCAALDLASSGIRVNSIHPGLMDTPILEGLNAAQLTAALADIPSGKMGRPLDVAEAVVFFASDAARYITGVELPVASGAGI